MTPDRKNRILTKLSEVVGGHAAPYEGAGGNVVKSRGSLKDTNDRTVTTEQLKNLAKRKKITPATVAKAGKVTRTFTPADGGMG